MVICIHQHATKQGSILFYFYSYSILSPFRSDYMYIYHIIFRTNYCHIVLRISSNVLFALIAEFLTDF